MSRELLKRVLAECADDNSIWRISSELYCAILEYIETPEPEPVAWMSKTFPTTFAISEDIAQPARFFTPLYAEPVDQLAQIAALKHELQQADEDYVAVEEAYLQCQKDLYDETEKLSTIQSKLKPLTDEELDTLRQGQNNLNFVTLREFRVIARAVEKQHGITS